MSGAILCVRQAEMQISRLISDRHNGLRVVHMKKKKLTIKQKQRITDALMEVLAHPNYDCNPAGTYIPDPLYTAVEAIINGNAEEQ